MEDSCDSSRVREAVVVDSGDSAYDESLRLVQSVTRAFYVTAHRLDQNRDKIRAARIACGVAVGVGVGASIVAAAATGGLSVLLGGAAVSGLALAMSVALTAIARDILDHKDIRDLDSQWKALKVDFLQDKNIPQENRSDMEKWAKQHLTEREQQAVLSALDKTIADCRRVRQLQDEDTETLMESLLFLVLADFSALEILLGAMGRKGERPGAAVRRIALQMDAYRDDLLEAKARRLERQRLADVSQRRQKEEEELLLKSVHEHLTLAQHLELCPADSADDDASSAGHEDDGTDHDLTGSEEHETALEEVQSDLPVPERRESLGEEVVVPTQRQKRLQKERQWRLSVEGWPGPEPEPEPRPMGAEPGPSVGAEEARKERWLLEVEQRQRRLARREHWQHCLLEERQRRDNQDQLRKSAWRQAEQDLMDREEEEQRKRLLLDSGHVDGQEHGRHLLIDPESGDKDEIDPGSRTGDGAERERHATSELAALFNVL